MNVEALRLAIEDMDEGRVVEIRWEYVDKGFGNAQSLWLIRPDGSDRQIRWSWGQQELARLCLRPSGCMT